MSEDSGFIESERKFAVSKGFTVPGLDGVPGVSEVTAPRRYRLTAVYYDTPRLDLARAKVTLRRRTGGTDAGWHLKLPAGDTDRREIHAPLSAGRDQVPRKLLAAVSQWTGNESLEPVARLRTSRTVRHLVGDSGQVLAELADDRVEGSVPGTGGHAGNPGWQTAVRWREVEIELVKGGRRLLAEVGGRLTGAGATPSAAPSKLTLVLTEAGRLPA